MSLASSGSRARIASIVRGASGSPAGAKVEVADTDLQISHGRRIAVADAPGQPPTNGASASSGSRPTISTHVLDTERARPPAGVRVTLYRLDVGDARSG